MKKGRGLKYGVIGVGSMGEHHAHIISELAGVRLSAVADSDGARANRISAIYDIPVFKDYKEMLPMVEAVSIVTPTSTHFDIAVECLNAGKHVLIEKPLTPTSEEAQKLVDLAKSKGLVLAVGLIERFNPAFQEISKLVKKEKILGIQINRSSPFPERITDTSVVHDMMIHDLDLLLALLPTDEIESLRAEGAKIKSDKLDQVNTTIYFASGIIAQVEANRVAEDKTRKIIVSTEKGVAEADLLNKKIYIRDFQTHVPSTHYTKKNNQLTEELKDLIKSIKQSTRSRVTGEEGYKALKLAEEVEKACS